MLGKLFGRRSFEDLRDRADGLLEQQQFGAAKLAYEKAKDRAEGENGQLMQERVDHCRDEIARGRMQEAARLLEQGEMDLALSELEGAEETAASQGVVDEVRKRMAEIQREDAREQAEQVVEESDEDRMATISGSWEEDQHQEYLSYGEPFRDALLMLYEDKSDEALAIFEDLLKEAQDPRYLHFELGRARLMQEQTQAGVESLQSFLSLIGPDEGGDARLTAHMELAGLEEQAGDVEGAIGQFQSALEAMPDDPRPYLAMGAFFRRMDLSQEAIDVLESAQKVMGEARPEWRIMQELGLAHADLGNDEEAMRLLEEVIEFLISRQHLDLPPEATMRLGQLHENNGNRPRAADLYSMLAEGSDKANHYVYHREAGRVLADLGLGSQARRMLQRAVELAPDDPAQREDLERLLSTLN